MTILITGATGFIGSHLLEKLLQKKYKVVILKRTVSNLNRIKHLISRVKYYNLDEMVEFDKIFVENRIDIIIHLSAMYSKEDKGIKMKRQMNKINISLPEKLLKTAVQYNVKGFINTGTFFEYLLETKKPINEQGKIKPYNYYTVTKIKFENVLRKLANGRKIKAVTLKLFSPYGDNDNEKVIPLIVKSFLMNKKLLLTKGKQRLAFTYISDIVDAYLLTIKYLNKQNFKYDVFNIGNKHSYSLKEAVHFVKNISKKNIAVEFGSIRNKKDEDLDILCNSTKAREKLNWIAKINFKTGLNKTYNSYKKTI